MGAVPAGRTVVGVDVGGTSIRAAVVADDGEILDRVRTQTPASADALERAIAAGVAELTGGSGVDAVGLAVAGFPDVSRRRIGFAPHLPWRDADVADRIGALVGAPVVLEHDANAAMWGEWRFGAAAGVRVAAMLLIGTGIGGAIVIDGEIYRGAFGVAPEFGHLRVVPDGRRCACGKRGCLERYCSGTALVDTAVEMVASATEPRGALAEEIAADPGSLTGRRVMAAARRGDRFASAAVDDMAEWLGVGLSVVADVLDPELIVLGGGVADEAAWFLEGALASFGRHLTGAGHRTAPRIRRGLLGADAGIIGAADLARRSPTS